MKQAKSGLSGALGVAIVVGAFALPGCSNDGPTPAPETKGKRDEVQKARETATVGDAPPAKKPAGR
jgi:hypothetical protein